jgi:BMFP domain-containing protein YqiC
MKARIHAMNEQNVFEQIARDITRLIPADISNLRAELEQNIQEIVAARLAEMGLVTREEFEVQQEVLMRTRGKLEEMNYRLAELEKQLR